ncbi:hypothetical protein GEMRC1_014097 [Eukaryota sp. GEM-RC1]
MKRRSSSQFQVKRDKYSESFQRLPIHDFRDEIVNTVSHNQVTVLVGETGSGKTTQVPQFLLDQYLSSITPKKVVITQPRRVAAQSIAARVSQERGVILGREVGYTVRFNDLSRPSTQLLFVTDGILLREMTTDPLLSNYSVVMLDEVHERSINTDLLLALFKILLEGRPDLRLVISSATMDADVISKYFSNCPIITVPGKTFEVEDFFVKTAVSDYVDACVRTVLDTITSDSTDDVSNDGDILCFLTGQDDIDDAIRLLHDRLHFLPSSAPTLVILPLYSALPVEEQTKVFQPTPIGCRKIVFSTNIAETSVTIPNISVVIDCGFSKQRVFDPRLGTSSLLVTPISKASAKQRGGRAGRTRKGKCMRMYTKWVFEHDLEEATVAEIKQRPSSQSLARSLDNLFALGLVDSKGVVTSLGKKASLLPLSPHYSVSLINSVSFGVFSNVCGVLAILSSPPILVGRRKSDDYTAPASIKSFIDDHSDHVTLLNLFNGWLNSNKSPSWARDRGLHHGHLTKVLDTRKQLFNLCVSLEMIKSDHVDKTMVTDEVLKALVSGMFQNIAVKRNLGGYATLRHGQVVKIDSKSFVVDDRSILFVVFNEIIESFDDYIMKVVSVVDQQWIQSVVPHVYQDYIKSFKSNK